MAQFHYPVFYWWTSRRVPGYCEQSSKELHCKCLLGRLEKPLGTKNDTAGLDGSSTLHFLGEIITLIPVVVTLVHTPTSSEQRPRFP